MNILNKLAPIQNKGQPGAWNDLDILEVGNSGMTDDEYKSHMSMWYVEAFMAFSNWWIWQVNDKPNRALVKSPLLMGNDITQMDPATLSILSNPAILAISQDPLGLPAYRVWQKPATQENNTHSTALYTAGETSFWVGQLNQGDFVIAFLNGAGNRQIMTADMDDIFVDQTTQGTSAPVKMFSMIWDIYDLWGYRMDNATAMSIINGNATSVNPVISSNSTLHALNNTAAAGDPKGAMRYNSTVLSYPHGVAMNISAMLGKHIGALMPGGSISADVPRHGIAIYRLRSRGGGDTMRKRDEL